MALKTVSIITTTRNRRNFVARAVESVLAQDYPAIEHVIVDANSSDGTADFLKTLEPRYRAKGFTLRWISEPDSGLSEGINKGVRLSTGEYITLLHDDERLELGAVAAFVKAFDEHPDVDLVYGDCYCETAGKEGRTRLSYRLYTLHDMVRGGYQIPEPAFLCKKSLIERCGNWDESFKHIADHDLFIRFAIRGAKFLYIGVPFELVEIHPTRTTNRYFRRTVEETKLVNFRYGGGYFSRYYILYLRDRYFAGFFDWMREHFPGPWNVMKKIFNAFTDRGGQTTAE